MKVRPYAQPPIMTVTHRLQMLRLLNRLLFLSLNNNTLNDEETNPSYKHSPIKLPCGHIFGRECIYKWSRLENSCPLCRQKISESVGVQRAAQQDTDEVAANEAAFERIRRVLYDPTAVNSTNENSSAPSENTSNTTVPTIGNASSGEQMLSRTGFFSASKRPTFTQSSPFTA